MDNFEGEKINRTTFWFLSVIVVLIILLLFSFFRFISVNNELKSIKQEAIQTEVNQSVIAFMNLFIDNVLKNNSVVDFEDRLKLENSVRAIGDDNIKADWDTFINSNTQTEAQDNVVKLLSALINKIQ